MLFAILSRFHDIYRRDNYRFPFLEHHVVVGLQTEEDVVNVYQVIEQRHYIFGGLVEVD